MRAYLSNLNGNPAATDIAIAEAEKQLHTRFPKEYVEFLKLTNGGEGFIGKNSYAILWSVQELHTMDCSYEVQKYVPGLLLFGSNGAGEAYGFDRRTPQLPIVSVPFVGMPWNLAQTVGSSFNDFLGTASRDRVTESNPQRRVTELECRGKEIFEISPVILGGSPTDPANKIVLTKNEHIQAVVYWNGVVAQLRNRQVT